MEETKEKKSAGIKAVDGKAPEAKKGGRKLVLIIGLLAVILVAGGVYTYVAMRYRENFLPNTVVNGIDVSEMDAAEVGGILENELQTYSIEITGRDYATAESGATLGVITAADISLTYRENNRMILDEILEQQDIFSWLFRRMSTKKHEVSLMGDVAFDKALLADVLNGWEACSEKNVTAPRDAYISEYSEELNGYEVIPEVIGTKLDMEQTLELIDAAIIAQETTLNLEEAGCYEEAAVTSQDEALTETVAEANRMLKAQITYDWNGTEVVVDSELLREWVSIEQDEAVLDENAVKAFVKEQAEQFDTYGKPRRFMTTLGIELTLPSGYYGWKTDKEAETEELMKLIQAGNTGKREPVYSSTAKKKGMSDIGSSYIEADLTHQHLYVYQEGEIVLETDFVSGSMSSTPDCVTPQGVFGLAYKTTNAVLRGADYVTPVNYWMPFYGNYGMHDATWRSEFGGDIYIANGSHGCLNLPLESAAAIYGYVSTGSPIICYYYPVDPLATPIPEDGTDDSEE